MDLSTYSALLEKLDSVRVSLEEKRALIIKQGGENLLAPLMDQSLKKGDAESISTAVVKKIKSTAEFKEYVKVRKAANQKLLVLLQELDTTQDFSDLAMAEIAATTKNDIIDLARERNLRIE